MSDFQAIWRRYRQLTGRDCPKKRAEVAYAAALKKTTAETITARLEMRWRDEWRHYSKRRFIPHLSSFLNGEDWVPAEVELPFDDAEPSAPIVKVVMHECISCRDSHWWRCDVIPCTHRDRWPCPVEMERAFRQVEERKAKS